MRIIDADALIEDIKEWGFIGETCAIEAVTDAPTIEPKRGEWKRMKFTDCGSPVDKCSICGNYINGDVEVRNFCPNCGADMRGTDNEV